MDARERRASGAERPCIKAGRPGGAAKSLCEAWPVRSRLVTIALVACLAAVSACGASSDGRVAAGPEAEGRGPAADHELATNAPVALRRVHAQAGELLHGGLPAFRTRLAQLRGYPVVVNKWASWCTPCRKELPYFRHQANVRGDRVAFLGANTNDSPGAARRFLAEVPIPFPSYADPEGEIARYFEGAIAFPATAFYDRRGRLATVKQGVYETERDLVADIERYAR
jgi:cytochrome c biogenesis protein CcmG, thiol:disulfide interchange protein DsbE